MYMLNFERGFDNTSVQGIPGLSKCAKGNIVKIIKQNDNGTQYLLKWEIKPRAMLDLLLRANINIYILDKRKFSSLKRLIFDTFW